MTDLFMLYLKFQRNGLYLLDEVSMKGDISVGFVGNRHGDDVCQSLYFVDDGVGVREVFPVIYPHLTAS